MLKRQRTYFLIDHLLFEVEKPEITLRKIQIAKVKIENEEYKILRKKFDEEIFNIEKRPDGWVITEKE
jgi:predicted metal-binding transcription factor (methanogenesis marker protein 9)